MKSQVEETKNAFHYHPTHGSAERIRLPAQFRIITESWNRCVTVPYMGYMPEKDRLLMLVNCEYPHRAFVGLIRKRARCS